VFFHDLTRGFKTAYGGNFLKFFWGMTMDQLIEQIAQLRERLDRLDLRERREVSPDDRLTTPQVARRYNVSDVTIKNWRKDPRKNFPKGEADPSGRIRTLESELRQYDLKRPFRNAAAFFSSSVSGVQ
jgi:DNA-binding transcriptional regulator YiaG